MKITHDRTRSSIVSLCDECPYWVALSNSDEEARQRAARHKMLVHDVPESRATEASRKAATRRDTPSGA